MPSNFMFGPGLSADELMLQAACDTVSQAGCQYHWLHCRVVLQCSQAYQCEQDVHKVPEGLVPKVW